MDNIEHHMEYIHIHCDNDDPGSQIISRSIDISIVSLSGIIWSYPSCYLAQQVFQGNKKMKENNESRGKIPYQIDNIHPTSAYIDVFVDTIEVTTRYDRYDTKSYLHGGR